MNMSDGCMACNSSQPQTALCQLLSEVFWEVILRTEKNLEDVRKYHLQ
jgi:hypothetical protein